MAMHAVYGSLAPIQAQMHMMYRNRVPDYGRWHGLRNPICVAWYLESGSVQLNCNGKKLHAEANQWVFQSPGLQLDQIFDPDSHLISIRFHLRWNNGQHIFNDGHVAISEKNAFPGLKKAALQLLKHGNYEAQDLTSIMRSQQVFGQWLNTVYPIMLKLGFQPSAAEQRDSRINLILDILRNALQENDVPYGALCQTCNLSRVHLNRLFKQQIGHSPKQEHDRLRIEYAHSLLNDHSLSIKNIANALGFSDSSQFTKWFRRLDGDTPSAARKRLHF